MYRVLVSIRAFKLSEGKRKHQAILKKDPTNCLCYCMHLNCC